MPRQDLRLGSRLQAVPDHESVPVPDASITTDGHGRILAWSAGTEEILGHAARTAMGAPLGDVLEARDLFGNRVCTFGCAIQTMRRQDEPIRPFVVDVRTASGTYQRVVVRVAWSGAEVVYSLRTDRRRRVRDRRSVDLESLAALRPLSEASHSAGSHELTPTEVKVLRLLVAGSSTASIGETLGISPSTARNHIQHVLGKLGVHSKLEAVSQALRRGLV